MKNLFLIIGFFTLATNITLAQSKIDEIKGFKGIKIGDNISKWENSLHNKIVKGNETAYLFVNQCCEKLFDFKIASIYLVFADNILISISITTDWFEDSGTWRETEFTEIKNQLEFIFGTSTGYFTPDKKKGNITWYWDGKLIYMQSEYDWHGSLKPNRVIINIIDKNHIKNRVKNGF